MLRAGREEKRMNLLGGKRKMESNCMKDGGEREEE